MPEYMPVSHPLCLIHPSSSLRFLDTSRCVLVDIGSSLAILPPFAMLLLLPFAMLQLWEF